MQQFYDILNEECIGKKLCFQFRLKKFALSLQPEIELNDNYEDIIAKEIRNADKYSKLYQDKSYKLVFALIEFIRKIEEKPTDISNSNSRGTTHDDEYIKTLCKFFMSFIGEDESNCD